MSASRELILEIGAEGGSLSVWCVRQEDDSERYLVKRNEAALQDLLNEEDAEGFTFHEQSPPVNTFAEALHLLGRYRWQHLSPVEVHPGYLDIVLQEVTRLGGVEQAERWKRILRKS